MRYEHTLALNHKALLVDSLGPLTSRYAVLSVGLSEQLSFAAGKSRPYSVFECLQMLSDTLAFVSQDLHGRRRRFSFWWAVVKSRVLTHLYPQACVAGSVPDAHSGQCAHSNSDFPFALTLCPQFPLVTLS